jgi:tripartite ATP-independent transporter DctM subunit
MSPITTGVIGIVALLVIMFLRMPIGAAMALVGFIGFSYLVSLEAALNVAVTDIWTTFSSYSFTVIPLFILMGQVLFNTGVSRRLYSTAYKWLGHLPGGLCIATIGACAGFAAICGSAVATAATMGTVSLPEMRRYKYDMSLATGTVAAGGTLGILIPPSVTFIIYGILVEQSIGKLFIAGIFPGLLLAGLFMGVIYILTRRNLSLGPPGARATWRERMTSLTGVGETLALFALVMGGLFAGFFTPTEAAGIGAGGAFVLSLVRRELTWRGIISSLLESLRTSCMVLVIIAGATIFGHFLAVTKIPFEFAGWISGLPIPPVAIMLFIGFMYLVGGCVMEALPLIILTVPIFYPVCIAQGFDPIWFGVWIVVLGQIGMLTPPVGMNIFVVSGVAKDVPLEDIFRGVVPFILAMLVCVIILLAFPQIALFLPHFMG